MTDSKPTWVFVAGTYRTASTTHYLITRDVVELTKSGMGIGYHTESKLEEFDDPENNKNAKFVVCKVFKFLPQHSKFGKEFLAQGRLKAVCTIRDPRDIIVSMRTRGENRGRGGKHSDVTFDFDTTVKENFPIWLGQAQQWIDLGSQTTLLTRFEDFVANLFRETRRIANHLDIDLPKELAHEIAKKYTIQAQRETKRRVRAEDKQEDPWLPSIPAIVFGASGIYTSWLSTVEKRMVEEHNGGVMKKWGYL